jgi:hypothetical protein
MTGSYDKVAADRTTSKGLGLAARIVLAVFSSLFAVVMFVTAHAAPQPVFSYCFGGICVVITLACVLPGRPRRFFGSIVGVVLFVAAVWYLFVEIGGGPLLPQSSDARSILTAAIFALVCGLPGIRYALTTRFGFRGRSNNRSRGP